jgi:hypothetical protein
MPRAITRREASGVIMTFWRSHQRIAGLRTKIQ